METMIIVFLLRNLWSILGDKLVNRFSPNCYANTKKMAANFEWWICLRLTQNSLWKKTKSVFLGEKEFLMLEIADKGAGRYLGVYSTFRRWYSIRRQGGAYKDNLHRNEEHFASRFGFWATFLKECTQSTWSLERGLGVGKDVWKFRLCLLQYLNISYIPIWFRNWIQFV